MSRRLLIADSPAEIDAARSVEARVFLEAFENTPEAMAQEYGPYAGRSRFVTVIDDGSGTAVGTARLIVPDTAGHTKSLSDAAAAPWHLPVPGCLRAAGLGEGAVWDVATLAVDAQYRAGAAGLEIVLALCHGIYRYAQASGAAGAVTILDDRVLRLLRVLGLPWVAMAGATSKRYLGSPASTPCVSTTRAIAPSIRTRRPDLAPALLDGTFRTIELTPAELLPSRGRQHLLTGALNERPLPTTARPAAWQAPSYRGSRLGAERAPNLNASTTSP